MVYYVSCSECELDCEMEDVGEILDLQEEHQKTHTDEHILEFELIGRE